MSTRSPTDFEWSVKLIFGRSSFCVGIASELNREGSYIDEYDSNAIFYYCWSPSECGIGNLSNGMGIVHHSREYESGEYEGNTNPEGNLKEYESGDVIRFRFQPQTKKLLIDLVSF